MDAAAAIGDPVRRRILELLHRSPRTVHALAGQFPISRPAVSRHLRVLREAGLVVDEPAGRERVYRLDPTALHELDAWLHLLLGDPWSRRLDALETEVHRTRRDRRTPRTDAPATDDTQEDTA
ncbi:ArsR/SmtB family transcription factor [Desertihabitans aurantiacus]|uniref:ArsR/SmtB family transcription factor n=1 Tax=Desertihabitans aurantiacus TaxID=2282477 RepID=UPI000DF8277B|nr:metalloregulator ArsR/SmtB family transcription factor [Desertihabitans aurantiacus]